MAKISAGEKFTDYTVDTVKGREIVKGTSISSIMGGKPVMIWFQRYMGCPPCRLDVHLLVTNYEKFLEKGVEIAVVMQSKPEIVIRDMVDSSLPFHLICDPAESLYKDLEIGDMAKDSMTEADMAKFKVKRDLMAAEPDKYQHGEYEGNEAQAPAWFWLAPDMTVLEAHYAKNIADMPSAQDALAKLG